MEKNNLHLNMENTVLFKDIASSLGTRDLG